MHYEDRMSADKKRQVLQNIDDAVERMTHMLGNVMQIGRSGAGQLQFRPKPLAINPFCMALVEELHNSMPRQFEKVQLELDLCPPVQRFLLDEALIRNIVGNLLSNAVKYSPEGGTVRLSAHESDGAMVLTVTDQGIGIPEADQALLFQSFHRASNGRHCWHRAGPVHRERSRQLPPGHHRSEKCGRPRQPIYRYAANISGPGLRHPTCTS